MGQKFAVKTKVPFARTRGEIDTLLRDWGCDGIRWTDLWADERVTVEFMWSAEDGDSYMCRFSFETEEGQGARSDHRILLLFLKGAFNGIAAGLIEPTQIFLAFIVGKDGRTVYENVRGRLPEIAEGNASLLLGEGR